MSERNKNVRMPAILSAWCYDFIMLYVENFFYQHNSSDENNGNKYRQPEHKYGKILCLQGSEPMRSEAETLWIQDMLYP